MDAGIRKNMKKLSYVLSVAPDFTDLGGAETLELLRTMFDGMSRELGKALKEGDATMDFESFSFTVSRRDIYIGSPIYALTMSTLAEEK